MRDSTPSGDDLRKFDSGIRSQFEALPAEKQKKQRAKTFILFPFELKLNQEKPFEEKEQDSLDLITNHLRLFKRCYVATSYGMDSVVLMDLVIKAAKAIGKPIPDMILNDTLNTFKEEKAYWEQMNAFFGIQLIVLKPPKDKNGVQQTVWSIAKKVGHLPSFRGLQGRAAAWKKKFPGKTPEKNREGSRGGVPECCDILKKNTLKNIMKEHSLEKRYDCHFIGTRAEESSMRKFSVLQRCRTYLIATKFPYPLRAVTPLSYWTKTDIYQYYQKYNIPKNPTYEIHNLKRLGCASCPAYKGWEITLAKDPTQEGFGMLKQNLKILKDTEPERFLRSLDVLRKYLKHRNSQDDLNEEGRTRLIKLLSEFDNSLSMDNFVK